LSRFYLPNFGKSAKLEQAPILDVVAWSGGQENCPGDTGDKGR
jgi:hypothetical protein